MYYLKNLYKKATFGQTRDHILEDELPIAYWSKELNLGDLFNIDLFKSIFPSKRVKEVAFNSNSRHFVGIGSILQLSGPNSVIAGSGFISKQSELIKLPNRFISVRGKLTADKLRARHGISVKVYGDLGLYANRIFECSKVEKRYRYGIVPHYTDYEFLVHNFTNNPDTVLIDIRTNKTEEFFAKLNQCEHIISSSLHGLIFADAFQIPNQRMRICDKIVGGNFKYYDYYSSVDRDFDEATLSLTDLNNIERYAKFYLGKPNQEMMETIIYEIRNAL